MNDRLMRFNKLETHPMFGKSFKKLTPKDLDFCRDLLVSTLNMDKNAFASKVVRLWLDKEKPKNWTRIEEILLSCI